MKKRLFSLVLVCAAVFTGFGSRTLAQEVRESESKAEEGIEETMPEETVLKETVPEETVTEQKETKEASVSDERGRIKSFICDASLTEDIYYANYMKNGKDAYIESVLPSVVTAVFEYGEPMEVEAHWIAERPFGVRGAGEYTYTLDFARYDIADDFDKAAAPVVTLRAVCEKPVSVFQFGTPKKETERGLYDEQQASFSYGGGAQPSDYGGYTTQYFNINFEGKSFTGICGKASYMAPGQGSYYVHEIPGGTRESDIVKAILLTNPLTGPYPDDTWTTIADGKFNDKMLWSVHSALSVYWSDDEFGSDWIRVNAITEIGNYLYDVWIPAHKSIMDATHAYYLCASSTPHSSDNFGGKCPSGRQDVLFLSDEVTPQKGFASLKKISSDTGITSGNSCYRLGDAIYGVYSDSECKNNIGTLKTGADGVSNTLELEEGFYYIKELQAPEGFFINTQVYTIHVKANETATVQVADKPAVDTLGIEIKKMDASGKTGATLSGAQFTVKYYDGYYTKDNLPSKSDRTWVLETKAVTEQGKVSYKTYLDEKYKVSGGSFYTQDRRAVLPLGTVTIEETKPPKGYILEGGYIQAAGSDKKVSGKYIAQIRKKGKTVQLVGGNVFTASDYSTSLRINKIDARTGKGLAGAKLRVTDKNGRMIDEWRSDGKARVISNLTVGDSYTMTEVEMPDGYATAEPVKFTVKNTQQVQNVEMKDEPTIKQINKVDAKTGEGLAGAKLRITDESGKVIDEWVSDGSPHAIEKLVVGKTYTLTEIGLPDGYVTAEPVKFTVKDTGEIQKVVMKNEQSVIQVDKVDEDGKPLPGALLRVTDKNNKRIDEWTSDGKGHIIKKLVVGQEYTLTEVKAPDGYVTAEPVKFTVKDTDEIQKIKMVNKCTRIEIIKIDAETEDTLAGASLTLYSGNEKDKAVDTWVSDITPHKIMRLTVGQDYILKEERAPEGYKLAEPVAFKVLNTEDVQKIQIDNEREDIPPQTETTVPPKESEPPKPEAPKTGDWMNVPLWGGMTVLSGVAAVGLLIIKLKKKK